uniref:Ig-like domain-containing protein n=1 Tax=Mesocestoides corti TaxID=53468 RepID=A0A5K3G5K7_MESCO
MKPITVKWSHNGQEVQRSDRFEEVFVQEQGLAKLTIRDFAPEDVGQYTCEVSGEIIEPETGMLPRARTISTTTIVEMAESMPEVEEEKPEEEMVEERPVLETPSVQICEL